MDDIRIMWEPKSDCELALVSSQVSRYMDNEASFAMFPSGTCLMLKDVDNLDDVIRGSMIEARKITDFKVYPMEEGDYLVFFASPLLVYVGKEEFEKNKPEITKRINELKFPSENVLATATSEGGRGDIDLLVGLYARGKLQRDAWGNCEYKVIRPV